MTPEQKRHVFDLLIPSIALGFAVYFGYAAIQGGHGVLARAEIEIEKQALQEELASVNAKLDVVSNKVRRLSDDYLDLDLLDQQARDVLGLARVDEIILK